MWIEKTLFGWKVKEGRQNNSCLLNVIILRPFLSSINFYYLIYCSFWVEIIVFYWTHLKFFFVIFLRKKSVLIILRWEKINFCHLWNWSYVSQFLWMSGFRSNFAIWAVRRFFSSQSRLDLGNFSRKCGVRAN